jgi:hypothetical protein
MLILRNMFVNTVLIILFVIAFTVEGQTTPLIKSMNISFIQGGTVNITGSGFGTKSPAKPYLWADFNTNINPTNLGRHTSWYETEYVKYQAGCGPDGSGCAMDLDTPPPGEGPMARIRTTGDFGAGAINTLGQKSYVYRKQKHNFNVSSYNLKTFRLWPLNAGPGPNNYINEGNSSSDCEGCDNYCWALNNDWASNTNWYTQEIVMQANTTLANTDGILKVYNDSTLWYNCGAGGDGSHSWAMRCTANNYDEQELYFLHAVIANTPTWNGSIHFYYDDIYVDDTWSRVMICSGSTWNSRGHCEIQIPSAWSCSGSPETCSINAVVNKGSFFDGNKVYLYVVDSNNKSSNSCPITIGKSGPIICNLQ